MAQIWIEVVICLGIVLYIWYTLKFKKTNDYRTIFRSEKFDVGAFRTGDIIITFGDYLEKIHPGHMGIVIETGPYNQKYVWDLDSSENLTLLKPILGYIKNAYLENGKVFVRHINRALDPTLLLNLMKKYKSVKYDYTAIVQHGNFLLHKFFNLPGIPIISNNSNNSSKENNKDNKVQQQMQYCSEVIFNVLADYGILDLSIINNVPDLDTPNGHTKIIYPETILVETNFINRYLAHGIQYEKSTVITF
jgi:hypothetical protein